MDQTIQLAIEQTVTSIITMWTIVPTLAVVVGTTIMVMVFKKNKSKEHDDVIRRETRQKIFNESIKEDVQTNAKDIKSFTNENRKLLSLYNKLDKKLGIVLNKMGIKSDY